MTTALRPTQSHAACVRLQKTACFAGATIELVPTADTRGVQIDVSSVAFCNSVGQPYKGADGAEMKEGVLRAVVDGIKSEIEALATTDGELSECLVCVRELRIHEIDSFQSTFKLVAQHAMRECLDKTGLMRKSR